MRSAAHKAFSLVELTTSATILSILALLLYATVDSSSKAWLQSEQRSDAFREARAALHYIARDIQSAIPLTDNDSFFITKHRGGHNHIHIDGGKEAPEGHGDCLFLLCAQPASLNGGDIAIVGYYLSYWPEGDDPKAFFKLHRYYRNSAESASLLSNRLNGELVTFANALGDQGGDEVLARNVIDFAVVPYRREESGNLIPVKGDWQPNEIPAMVEVSVSAYDSRSASQLQDYKDWLDTESDFAKKHLRRFSTKVVLATSK